MYDAKNAYLIAISVSNAHKARYFRETLPALHDNFQRLWSQVTQRIVSLIVSSVDLTADQLAALQRHKDHARDALASADPVKDQRVFLEFNKRPFFEPPEAVFEPCAVWHDDVRPKLALRVLFYHRTSSDAKAVSQNR
jgi:formin-binding protein 1